MESNKCLKPPIRTKQNWLLAFRLYSDKDRVDLKNIKNDEFWRQIKSSYFKSHHTKSYSFLKCSPLFFYKQQWTVFPC